MNSVENSIENQQIINVLPEEKKFFKKFVKKHGIRWDYSQQENNILVLSASLVGFINTPYRQITLSPKYSELTFKHVLRLYLYVYSYNQNSSSQLLDVSDTDTSFNLADQFFSSLEENIHKGIDRQYVIKESTSKAVKGRLRANQTLMNLRMFKERPISSNTFKLSMNTPINKIIVGALLKLYHVDAYKSKSLYFMDLFDSVTRPVTKNGDKAFRDINFNSNNEYYRKTLSLAAMIIDDYEYEDFGDDKGTDSFLINFDALYEDFVIKVLSESSVNLGFSIWEKMELFASLKNTNQSIVYKPDILFKYKKEDPNNNFKPSAYAVLDCKNKAYHIFKNADVYQLISYSRKLNAHKALLLYPSFKERHSEQLLLDRDLFSPSEIYASFINIGDIDQSSFLASIDSFRNEVLRIIYG